MELNDLIPKKYKHLDSKWKISDGNLLFKNLQFIPLCYISDEDIVYIYFDNRIKKQLFELVKLLIKKDIEFYFTIVEISDPAGVFDYNEKVIENYLYMFIDEYFYKNFKKINFDLIDNMVKWTLKNKCFSDIKPAFDYISNKVKAKNYDYYTQKSEYEYSEEIRNEFETLYREIIINQIINFN